jgi:hypothetical protein
MKSMKKIIFILTVSFLTFQGCTNYEATLSVEETEFPISMTEYLYSEDLNEIGENGYRVVGKFKFTRYMTGLFHGKLPLTKTSFELSDDINEAIRDKGGNAMVNFKIKSTSNALVTTIVGGTGTVIMPLAGLIMALNENYVGAGAVVLAGALLPNISKVKVTGDIVMTNSSYGEVIQKTDNGAIIKSALGQVLADETTPKSEVIINHGILTEKFAEVNENE